MPNLRCNASHDSTSAFVCLPLCLGKYCNLQMMNMSDCASCDCCILPETLRPYHVLDFAGKEDRSQRAGRAEDGQAESKKAKEEGGV